MLLTFTYFNIFTVWPLFYFLGEELYCSISICISLWFVGLLILIEKFKILTSLIKL